MKEIQKDDYSLWQKEIHARRIWLLKHNQKFCTELAKVAHQPGYEDTPIHPLWHSLSLLPNGRVVGDEYPPLREFCVRYGLGTNWPENNIIARYGERPFGIEVVGEAEQAECIKLVIWPNELKKKNIGYLWPFVEKVMNEHFELKEVPWSLKVTNFWRDAYWYQQRFQGSHWENKEVMSIRDIARKTVSDDPITIHILFLENLMNRKGDLVDKELLNKLDPDGRIRNDFKLAPSTKIKHLLHAAGILIVGDTFVDWGYDFSYRDFSLLEIDMDSPFRKQGRFFIYYKNIPLNRHLFKINPDELKRLDTLAEMRKYFLAQQQVQYLEDKVLKDCEQLITVAIKRMIKRIDSVC